MGWVQPSGLDAREDAVGAFAAIEAAQPHPPPSPSLSGRGDTEPSLTSRYGRP